MRHTAALLAAAVAASLSLSGAAMAAQPSAAGPQYGAERSTPSAVQQRGGSQLAANGSRREAGMAQGNRSQRQPGNALSNGQPGRQAARSGGRSERGASGRGSDRRSAQQGRSERGASGRGGQGGGQQQMPRR